MLIVVGSPISEFIWGKSRAKAALVISVTKTWVLFTEAALHSLCIVSLLVCERGTVFSQLPHLSRGLNFFHGVKSFESCHCFLIVVVQKSNFRKFMFN